MPQVLVPQFVHEPGPTILRQAAEVVYWDEDRPPPRDRLEQAIAGADGLLCQSNCRVDAALLERAGRLRVVSNVAAGYDNIDLAAATARRIAVCNTPVPALHETTADLTFALILAVARRLGEAERYIRAGRWTHWSPQLLVGADVYGRTLGIVGLGRIGQAVARRARGFGMNILYTGRGRRQTAERELGATFVRLDDLLRRSDFVSLHVPATAETRHMIGRPQLELMAGSAYLINAARGALVDQAALYEALRGGLIAGAGLDVFDPEPVAADEPLLTLENVVAVPHVGGASLPTRERMAETAARNALAVLAGREPPSCVNPEVLPG
ncbi:MAG TPA: D-glycerate dehydrogenase [Chloroflexota bacterium]